jgi:Calcineurin-like phosphoesterase
MGKRFRHRNRLPAKVLVAGRSLVYRPFIPATCPARPRLALGVPGEREDMPRFRQLISIAALCLLVGISFNPSQTVFAGPVGGPDFRKSDSELSHPLRIIAYGDTRFTDPRETWATNPKVRRWLVDQIAKEKPDAVLLSGDVPWHGCLAGDYDDYQTETRIWRNLHLNIYPALGNHEFSGGQDKQECLENFWNAFPELRGRRWYSVQLGSSVYVLNLDSNSSLMPGSEQIRWIKDQLATLPATVRFVLINLHHPPVVDVQANGNASHNGRPNEHALAEFLAQAPEKARVRFIVAAGHIHNYERFLQDGIVYLVSGGGGAKPRPILRGPSDLYQDPGFPNYNYVRFVLDGKILNATMVRVADPDASTPAWQEKDHFEVRAVDAASDAPGFKLTKRSPVPGDAGFDYIVFDGSSNRLYVSHVTEVNFLDAARGNVLGKVGDKPGVHGIAIDPAKEEVIGEIILDAGG